MKRTVSYAIAVTAFALMSFSVASVVGVWTIDAGHSQLGFEVKHLGITDFHGNFGTYEAKMTTGKEDLSDAKLDVTGQIASINTGSEARDGHLKSADFFDAEKYPTFTYVSKSFTKGKAKNEFIVNGDLTLHGVTKPVTLTAVFNGTANNPFSKKDVSSFKFTGSFKRKDFGVGTEFPVEVVSDEVKIVVDAELVKE